MLQSEVEVHIVSWQLPMGQSTSRKGRVKAGDLLMSRTHDSLLGVNISIHDLSKRYFVGQKKGDTTCSEDV